MTSKKNSTAYIFASIAIFFWAIAFTGVKYCLTYYSPQGLMLLRFLAASSTLLAIAYAKKVKLPQKSDLIHFIVSGTIGIFFYMFLFNAGTGMVQSGISSFIIASSPIFSLLFAMLFLKEQVRPTMIIGVIISAAGLFLVARSQVDGFSLNPGFVLLLVAALCTAVYNIAQRKLMERYTPIEATTFTVVAGTLLMLFFIGDLGAEIKAAPPHATFYVVLLGVFPGAVSYLSWNYAIGVAEKASDVTNFMYLTPFLATTLGFVLLKEVLPLLAIIGGAIIISGLIISQWRPAQKTGS